MPSEQPSVLPAEGRARRSLHQTSKLLAAAGCLGLHRASLMSMQSVELTCLGACTWNVAKCKIPSTAQTCIRAFRCHKQPADFQSANDIIYSPLSPGVSFVAEASHATLLIGSWQTSVTAVAAAGNIRLAPGSSTGVQRTAGSLDFFASVFSSRIEICERSGESSARSSNASSLPCSW